MVSDPVLGRVVPPVGGCWLSAATTGMFGAAVVLVVVYDRLRRDARRWCRRRRAGEVHLEKAAREDAIPAEPHTDRDRAAEFECAVRRDSWAPEDRSTSGTVTWLAEAIKMSLFGWTEALFSPVTVTSHVLPTIAGSTSVVLRR